MVSADYSAITTIGALGSPCSSTAALFDANYSEGALSAVDSYIENCNEINKLWAAESYISPEFSRLLLLGYVSAIESFIRTLLRSIINKDAKAQADAHSYVVPYGAVLYHQKTMIAEALLEGYSFASEKDVKKALEKFLDVSNVPESIKELLTNFEKICQMRHCCVHRFGKLGTQNGIALGLEVHSKALEKPLVLDVAALGEIASWLMSFAKALNNYIFRTLLDRSVSDKNPYRIEWQWSFSKDRVKFERIYGLFVTEKDGIPSPSSEELYHRFKLAKQPKPRC